jgi:hypothetical protein
VTRAALDPFGERSPGTHSRTYRVLGARLRFECDDAGSLALVDAAYAGLPRTGGGADFRVRIRSTASARPAWRGAPPEPRLSSGAGVLCGIVDQANYTVVDPGRRVALVAMSAAMRRCAYHARYELLEFAVFSLVARASRLAPLHAACIGWRGRGVLLLGDSGSGKSTLCLAALRARWQILSEDSVFVAPASLVAFGVPNYLHVTRGSLDVLGDPRLTARVRAAPVIERRSGARKFEFDLRGEGVRRTARLPLDAVVLLHRESANGQSPLRPMSRRALGGALAHTQPYARGGAEWSSFCRRMLGVPAFELGRCRPDDALSALRAMLGARA